MVLVRNVYNLRRERGWTLAELAARVQAYDPKAGGRTMLSMFENCHRPTSQRTLVALAAVLETTVDEILRVREVPAKPLGRPRKRPAAPAPPVKRRRSPVPTVN